MPMSIGETLLKIVKKPFFIHYTKDEKLLIGLKLMKLNPRKRYDRIAKKNPIEEHRIVFDNYMGKGYGCNPKYITEELMRRYPGQYQIVWVVREAFQEGSGVPEGVEVVKYGTQDALRAYASARVWVSNYHKIFYLKKGLHKRKGQRFIQTWHGSLGIKKIEGDSQALNTNEYWVSLARKSSEMVDYWISNSSFETKVYRSAFWSVKQVLEYGHPRNDLLLGDTAPARAAVEKTYGARGKKLALYAPTFRESYDISCYKLDYARLRKALSERFGGEWEVLIRMHPRVIRWADEVIPREKWIHDATLYPDIQELLASADCLISDYSSCMFDYMLMRRPVFVYATDIQDFDQERGFYYPLSETPFPVAESNDALEEAVRHFQPEAYQRQVDAFLAGKGCREDGHASERVAELIHEICDGDPNHLPPEPPLMAV